MLVCFDLEYNKTEFIIKSRNSDQCRRCSERPRGVSLRRPPHQAFSLTPHHPSCKR
jgi:hypothetical protein